MSQCPRRTRSLQRGVAAGRSRSTYCHSVAPGTESGAPSQCPVSHQGRGDSASAPSRRRRLCAVLITFGDLRHGAELVYTHSTVRPPVRAVVRAFVSTPGPADAPAAARLSKPPQGRPRQLREIASRTRKRPLPGTRHTSPEACARSDT